MNQILHKAEFDRADQETQKMLLTHWRSEYQNKEILKEMGISSNTLAKLIKELDIPGKPRGGARGARRGKAAVKTKEAAQALEQPQTEKKQQETEHHPSITKDEPVIQQAPVKLITIGSHLEYNGIYTADQLERIFTKAQLHIDGEPGEYYLTLAITEKEKGDKS